MPEEYNPCRHCKVLPIVKKPEGRRPFCRCPECRSSSLAQYWNENNPIDELELAQERLAECYALLAMLCHGNIGTDERLTIRALFDKHQAKYNAS